MRSDQPAKVIALLLSAFALFAALPAASHHSVRDAFDADNPVRISGTVTSTEWANPHMLIHLDVVSSAGGNEIWTLEMPSPNALRRRGLDTNFLAVGDRITVEVWPALDGSRRADSRLIEFADGSRIEIPESRWMTIDN